MTKAWISPLIGCWLLAACTGSPPAGESSPQEASEPAAAPSAAQGGSLEGSTERAAKGFAAGPGNPAAEARPRVVFVGDSLTAGYTLEEAEAFPARLGKLLEAAGHPVDVVNAGVSGDTSAGGLSRLPWLLRQEPDLVVVELGANDGLRGLPLEETEGNLRRIVEAVRAAGARVLLLGMRIPPNYGPDYSQGFAEIFPRLAEELDVPLVPFLLEGVAGDPRLNLPDGIHPTAEGHARVARTLLPYLEAAVQDLETPPPPP